MKQLLFCEKQDRKLRVRYTLLHDLVVPTQDIVSPQKTSILVPKTDKIQLSDIVIIRDNNTAQIEYLGYIDTLKNTTVTEIECYPLINVFDNDFVLDQLFKPSKNGDGSDCNIDVDVVEWLDNQLTRAFIDTEDDLQALPLVITKKTRTPVLYKKALDTANLFEAYLDVFIHTGVYIVFSGIDFENGVINGIHCDICNNNDENAYKLRYDNPQVLSIDIVDNTFKNFNKIIATEELEEGITTREPQRYYFYLLNDNSVTMDSKDPRRIKQVRSKEISFKFEEDDTNKEVAESLMLAVYNELQAPEYNLQITIRMLYNDNIKLYRKVDFIGESGIIYTSNITKIEQKNKQDVIITLGALRNSITDFKKKVEDI
jgi:hypothetical protein